MECLPGYAGEGDALDSGQAPSQQERACAPKRERSPSPAALLEEPLEILSRGNQERLTVHSPESPQPEPAHPMPVLVLSEERFHPDAAFAEGFLVGGRLLIAAHPLQIRLPHMAIKLMPLGTGRTLRLNRAVIAYRSGRAIE